MHNECLRGRRHMIYLATELHNVFPLLYGGLHSLSWFALCVCVCFCTCDIVKKCDNTRVLPSLTTLNLFLCAKPPAKD